MLISSARRRLIPFLIATGLGLAPSAAYSQSTDHLTKMLALLTKDNAGCSFRLEAAGTISANFELTSEFIVLWVYMIEGCGGGNNWAASVDAFYVKQPLKGASLVKKIPLSESVKDQTTFSSVKNVSFKSVPDSRTSSVEIDGLSMGDDDARCCPTAGRQVKLWIESGKIKSTVVKTWKEAK